MKITSRTTPSLSIFLIPILLLTLSGVSAWGVTVDLQRGRLTVEAEKTPLGELLEAINDKYPLQVKGLERRSGETITFLAKNDPPERLFKRLLRQLGETNYAFEFAGSRLRRVSVMPESRAGSSAGTAAPFRATAPNPLPQEEEIAVVRVDRVIEGSQAQALNLQKGDLVLEYDGLTINSTSQLMQEVKKKSKKGSVDMMVVRDGQPMHLALKGGFIGIHIVPHRVPRSEYERFVY